MVRHVLALAAGKICRLCKFLNLEMRKSILNKVCHDKFNNETLSYILVFFNETTNKQNSTQEHNAYTCKQFEPKINT